MRGLGQGEKSPNVPDRILARFGRPPVFVRGIDHAGGVIKWRIHVVADPQGLRAILVAFVDDQSSV